MVERVGNPYRPGFNQTPVKLAGREDILEAAGEALNVAALDGRTPRPLVLVGARGVGKTVLLGEIAELALTKFGWPTAAVEVRSDGRFLERLGRRLIKLAELLDQEAPRRGRRVRAANVGMTVLGVGGEIGLELEPTQHAPFVFEDALARAAEASMRHRAGFVITVDELQAADRHELGEFAATVQEAATPDWPVVVVSAGLPTLRTRGTVTYLERAEWHDLGLLDPAASIQALTVPAERAGRPLDESAAAALAEASGGYPFAIQVLGHWAWRASSGRERITAAHAAKAMRDGQRDLARNLYESRWTDASAGQRTYLRALAELSAGDHGTTGADVARALGASTRELSPVRDRLLKKGTLFADGRNLRFVVPGMAGWILDQPQAHG